MGFPRKFRLFNDYTKKLMADQKCSSAHVTRILRYNARNSTPLMASPPFASLHAVDTIKHTIDDADYAVKYIFNSIFFNGLYYFLHSHSIINELFLSIIFNGLFSC